MQQITARLRDRDSDNRCRRHLLGSGNDTLLVERGAATVTY
jgi:hypothetical protein